MKNCRGLDNVEEFKNSNWYKFYKEHKNELFLGIRNNYINIYYKGMNIAKAKGKYQNAQIHHKYLRVEKQKNDYVSINIEDFIKQYENIKKYVEIHIKEENKKEKEVQQELILRNNKNKKSKWICIDMEYQKQRKDKNDGKNPGRFDIIAVSKEKPHKVALIELKVGDGAFIEPSGLRKHAKDWEDFISDKLYSNSKERNRNDYLLKEIVNIINNNSILDDNYPIKDCKEEDFEKEPEFYFLICSGNDKNIKEIKNRVGQYLWKVEKARKYGIKGRISTKNIEKEIGYDITEKGSGILYCKFLFAEGEGKDIQDIVSDKNYNTNVRN